MVSDVPSEGLDMERSFIVINTNEIQSTKIICLLAVLGCNILNVIQLHNNNCTFQQLFISKVLLNNIANIVITFK